MSEPGSGRWKAVVAWVAAFFVGFIVTAAIIYVPRMLSGKATYEVSRLRITRADGSPVDLNEVPLGESLVFSADVKANYSGGDKASLELLIRRSSSEDVSSKTFEVSSSGEPRTFELRFTLSEGAGDPFSARAILEPPGGDDALKKESALPFHAAD